jgi:hypothetical protein
VHFEKRERPTTKLLNKLKDYDLAKEQYLNMTSEEEFLIIYQEPVTLIMMISDKMTV